MALANNMCSFGQGFLSSTSRPEIDCYQSEHCTTSLSKCDDISPKRKEILQLRPGYSHTIFICSVHEEMFMALFELRLK
jgi:hypothetical protein